MKFTATYQANTLILTPKGRIDHASTDAFSMALTPYLADCTSGGKPLILDFSEIEYISSIGLRALVLAARQVTMQDGQIAIAAPTPLVQKVFEVCRFHLVLKLFDSVDDALANFAVE